MDSVPSRWERIKRFCLGAPMNPFNQDTRHRMTLVALMAWVGLGADGLSSASYGPEEAFKVIVEHPSLGLFVALATALTVFIVSAAYTQVIKLFPGGGGGYRVATSLLGSKAGLVSGSALVIDYVLTVALSIAAATDALASLLPLSYQPYKLPFEIFLLACLTIMNLRGMKESIKILAPIFAAFIISHVGLMLWGFTMHSEGLPSLIPESVDTLFSLSKETSWLFVAALLLKSYSMGAGTYTGIEAVSNNVNMLKEPRVTTGKWTMALMAISLAFMAGGNMILYILWDVMPKEGQTMNAMMFRSIMDGWTIAGYQITQPLLIAVLAFEAGLLFVAANAGFCGGPSVLANMASDRWVPHSFSNLSSRLVTQNGIIIIAISALLLLLATHGAVEMLVVFYSINVFITFSLSLLGLCVYWATHRDKPWKRQFALSALGLMVTSGILIGLTIEKFSEGGWVTLLVTGSLVGAFYLIRQHYDRVEKAMCRADNELRLHPDHSQHEKVIPDPAGRTAVFLVGRHLSVGMHGLLTALNNFPGHFKNCVFLTVGEVDSRNFGAAKQIENLKQEVGEELAYLISWCRHHGIAPCVRTAFGTDVAEELTKLSERTRQEFPNSIFFATKIILNDDSWINRLLHNSTALTMQRRLYKRGIPTMLLPMRVNY